MLVASIITAIKDGLNKFIWWVIAYELINIIGVIVVILSDTKDIYGVAVGSIPSVSIVPVADPPR